ncbi:Hypothetical_protein [Hexamita inflata]|uniref:Hypothetical_protein n=1 Tax=Hexamita inflata TaxID=28002 RepID=A0AA86QQB8_9EUKA|nr:Hypothetical protein HINF_LOCUS46132 [Hexamita inflata]
MRKQYEHSEPDDQNDTYKRMRAERDIQFAMQNGGVPKAMGKALDYHNNTGHSEVPKAEIPRQVEIHFKNLKEEFKRILQLTQTNMQTKLAANYKLNSKWHKQQKTASPLQTSMSNQPSTAQDTTSQLETQTEIMQVPQHKLQIIHYVCNKSPME